MPILFTFFAHAQEESVQIKGKDFRVVYLTEPLNREDVIELEKTFHHLIAQLPFTQTGEIKRRLGKIEWMLRKEESLKDLAYEIHRYRETIRGSDIRLTIGERVALLNDIRSWKEKISILLQKHT
jgi:hypothetical protein